MTNPSTGYSSLSDGPIQEPGATFDPLQIGMALLARLPSGHNFVISPVSIASVLAMLHKGAKGRTRSELETVLHMSTDAVDRFIADSGKLRCYNIDAGTQLRVSNGGYIANDLTVKKDYLEHLDRLDANLTFVNFAQNPEAAREQINTWIAKETSGLIRNFLPYGAIDVGTALVLANAVYFKGLWREPFEAERTSNREFTVTSGKAVIAKMMRISSAFPYAVDERLRMQLLFLPYEDDDLGLLILLPLEGASPDACLHQTLSSATLANIVARMRSRWVNVVLPSFSVSSSVDVKKELSALGIASLFSDGANLSAMCRNRSVFVSSCLHRALIDVTEEGTKAAAATAVTCCVLGAFTRQLPDVDFACNRPFMFAIWHRPTAKALFFGRVDDPTLPV